MINHQCMAYAGDVLICNVKKDLERLVQRMDSEVKQIDLRINETKYMKMEVTIRMKKLSQSEEVTFEKVVNYVCQQKKCETFNKHT